MAEDGEGPEATVIWDDTSRTLVEECPTGLPVAGRSPTEALRRQIDDHELSEADADAVAILEAESGAGAMYLSATQAEAEPTEHADDTAAERQEAELEAMPEHELPTGRRRVTSSSTHRPTPRSSLEPDSGD